MICSAPIIPWRASAAEPVLQVELAQNAGTISVRIPELKLWTLVVLQ